MEQWNKVLLWANKQQLVENMKINVKVLEQLLSNFLRNLEHFRERPNSL